MVVVVFYYQYGPGQLKDPPIMPPGQEHDCNEWIYNCGISVRNPACPPLALQYDVASGRRFAHIEQHCTNSGDLQYTCFRFYSFDLEHQLTKSHWARLHLYFHV